MARIKDVLQNIRQIYDSNNSLNLLKAFERVLDELDIYVFDNWIEGELLSGPYDTKYFVTCTFMWPYKQMPDPAGGKVLLDYDIKVEYAEDYIGKVRKIKTPDDFRPGTKKGKIDMFPVWLVKITMPKKLMDSIEQGSRESMLDINDTGIIPKSQIQAPEDTEITDEI